MFKRFTLKELASLTKSQLVGDEAIFISGVNTLEEAGAEDASFLANPRYKEAMKSSLAGVICVNPSTPLIEGRNYLLSDNPSHTFQAIAQLILVPGKSGFIGIHPTAVIHETARIAPNVTIGPYSVIDRDVTIGEGTIIEAHVSIGFDVKIGKNCHFYPGSIVREKCEIHDRVILQPGAVIGSCGFGFIPNALGHYQKLEQLGIVILEEDVEIGANTTIDRSRFKATILRKGTKIDNLCQIAHNVQVGEHNVIAAQTGIAGSSKTGKHVMLGGQVGIVGHVELADGAMVATRGGVSKNLEKGKYRGSPAIAFNDYQRQEVHVRKLGEYVERIKTLEKKLAALEESKQL
jgi:UDP-3-O-[3-hydroxymyristoyl] glucosamine N-acyltransferase